MINQTLPIKAQPDQLTESSIDLTEATASKDTITLNIAVGGNDPMTISKVKGFNVASDMIDVGNYHLIKNSTTLGSTVNSGYYSSTDGTLRGDYVQFLNSPTTALMGPQGGVGIDLAERTAGHHG